MANTYLTRTQTTGDRQKMTWSFWIKISGSGNRIFNAINASFNSSYVSSIHFNNTGYLTFYNVDGSADIDVRPTRLYRDKNAWYHIVIAMDTTQSTASDRIKIYTNGVQETSFIHTTYPSQNADNTQWNYNGNNLTIGKRVYDTAQYTDAILSHFHFIDGTIYDPSAFGETDATTGEWKIKVDPSVTYGNNGFFIFKDGTNLSGSTVQDQSGQSNNFTAHGSLTKTEDSPSNVFATLNPLATASYATLTNGNLTVTGNTGANEGATFSSLVMPNATSKMYWEIKCVATTAGSDGASNPKYGFIQAVRGFTLANGNAGNGGRTNPSYDVMIRPNGNVDDDDGTSSISVSTWSAGDILSFALDNVNGAFYVGKNGTWQNSGNPASGSSRTGAIKTWSPTQGGNTGVLDGQAVCISSYNGSISNINFGNGFFGTTAVSSAGTNASGIGIFEYDVPNGFTALSTKGLNL